MMRTLKSVSRFRSCLYHTLLVGILLGSSCQTGPDNAGLEEVSAASTKSSSSLENSKKGKSGQYVSKSVQVTGYEDGRERPSRPKYDILPGGDVTTQDLPDEDCGDPVNGCYPGGGYVPPSTFKSSVDLGAFSGNPSGEIYAIRVISGSSSAVTPTTGHIKIPSDLNAGAGGKYIYLTFTRDPQYSYENDGYHTAQTFTTPITRIEVASYTQVCYTTAPYTCSIAPGNIWRHMFKFNETSNTSASQDLNDGAGGRYIYGHISRDATHAPIKEIGILSGSSSSIQPPDASWTKEPHDLNEGAGGNYIYICYKYSL